MPLRRGKLEVSPGFLLLAAWLNYLDGEGVFLWVLVSCFCHECGHLLVLHLLGVPVRQVRVTAVGAEICVAGGVSYMGELLAALAGPSVNLVLAAWFAHVPGGAFFSGINLVLGVFNLIPVGRLDGGRVLGCLLGLTVGPEWGHKIMCLSSWACTFALCVLGGWLLGMGGNGTLLLIALWMTLSMSGFGGKRRN